VDEGRATWGVGVETPQPLAKGIIRASTSRPSRKRLGTFISYVPSMTGLDQDRGRHDQSQEMKDLVHDDAYPWVLRRGTHETRLVDAPARPFLHRQTCMLSGTPQTAPKPGRSGLYSMCLPAASRRLTRKQITFGRDCAIHTPLKPVDLRCPAFRQLSG
jgi:hypothetical protein